MVRLPPRLRPLFPYVKPAYVTATRVVAPATQAISRGRLPRGSVATLAAAGGCYTPARPAEVIPRPPRPEGVPAGLRLADETDGNHLDAIGVAELPGGRVFGPHRAVVTAGGELVHEVSRYFGTTRPREHPLFLNPFPDEPRHVTGRLGVLACRGDANYYHFLMDVLPRLSVVEQAGVAPPQRWYVPQRTRFQRDLLDLVGITPEQRVDADEHPYVRADTLVVPNLPALTEKNPPWVVNFLRDRLLPRVDTDGPRRRVWITRGPSPNNRTVLNEDAVVALLAARGFEAVDPGALSVAEQIRTFATAATIVAAHGAALANLVFAAPGAAVVELFPSGYLLPDYWRMAQGVPGLRYRYLAAGPAPRRPTRARAIVTDITVDLGALERLLDELDREAS